MAILHLFKDSVKAFFADRSVIYAAGLAYYSVFAIAPLLVFVVIVAGVFAGQSVATSHIAEQVEYLVGPELAAWLTRLAETVSQRIFSARWTVLAIIGLLFSGAGIFTQLDTALNDIWGIRSLRPRSPGEWLIRLRQKLAPFIVVFVLGLLLGSSVLIHTLLGVLTSRLAEVLPWAVNFQLVRPAINRLVIPVSAFTLFTVIYKWLPDARSRWRDVAVGGLVGTVLFLIGRQILLLYLERGDVISPFGTAGSFVGLLIWVYYSAQILLFGAEFTKLYADRFGQPITPRKLAAFEELPRAVSAGE